MSLDITDVRVMRLKNPKTKIVGFATLTFNNVLVVEDWKIIEGRNGLFVTGPSKKTNDNENPYRDIVKLITKESNQAMQQVVIAKFKQDGGGAAAGGGRQTSSVREQYGDYMQSDALPSPDSDVPPPSDDDNRYVEQDSSDEQGGWFS